MTVLISPVYTGVSANDGTGDTIKVAFDKVNSSIGNLATVANTIQGSYANTSYGVFSNVTVTNRVIGSLNFYGADTIYVNGSPVATSASSFAGGNVAQQSNFQAATSSTSSTTGAVVITGGLGVSGNINTANAISTSGILTVSNSTDSSSTATGGIVTAGGLGVARNTHLGAGLYVTGQASIGTTLSVTGDTAIASTTASTGYSSGALLVAGGVGIAGNLNVDGSTSTFVKDVFVAGNLTAGNIISTSSTLTTSGPFIYLQNGISGDNGSDTGLDFSYYLPGQGSKKAFLGWDRASGNLKYYSIDATVGGGVYTGTYGSAVFGTYYAANTTASTDTTSGALQVAGGAGIAGNIYVGINAVVTGNVTGGNITASSKVTAVTGNVTTFNSLYLSSGTHTPFSNVAYNLGSTSNYWNSAYINSVNAVGITVNSGHILPGANIVSNIGSTASWFNSVYGLNFYGASTTAKYADLAEKYLPDADYDVGTVVCVGGEAEITASTFGKRAIGAISNNPAYKMNSDLEGGVYVALKGRVPIRVIGAVKKGDNLIAADNGCATKSVYHSSEVFAVALGTSDDTGVKLIEAIIL